MDSVVQLPKILERSTPIDRVMTAPLSRRFHDQYVRRRRPVLLQGAARGWPAYKRWTFDYLADLGGHLPVVLECGNVMQGPTRFSVTTLGTYIREVQSGQLVAGDQAYLSVFEILRELPELKEDVDFGLLTDHKAISFPRAWVGPAGTITGLHADYPDNLIAQIRGHKHFHLVSPSDTSYLYRSKKYEYGIRMSDVDVSQFSQERWPLFTRATVYSAKLGPGDMLFIPSGWWHHVLALEPSISVNCFSVSWREFLWNEGQEQLRAMLHRVGLLANGNCTCHGDLDGRQVARPQLSR